MAISNNVPFEWQTILGGLNILSIVIGKIDKDYNSTDILIAFMNVKIDIFNSGAKEVIIKQLFH